MAHYAKVEDGIVVNVIVAEQSYIDEQEGLWIQTSYNNNIRYNYAANGYTYDEAADAFIAPQPFPSWILNTQDYRWEAPVPYPEGDSMYRWDEAKGNWELCKFNEE